MNKVSAGSFFDIDNIVDTAIDNFPYYELIERLEAILSSSVECPAGDLVGVDR